MRPFFFGGRGVCYGPQGRRQMGKSGRFESGENGRQRETEKLQDNQEDKKSEIQDTLAVSRHSVIQIGIERGIQRIR